MNTYLQNRAREKAAIERAHRKAVGRAYDVQAALEALPADLETSMPQVVEVFATNLAGKTRAERYETFRLLDEQPGRFPEYLKGHWHRTLRCTRNSPHFGPALFDAINAPKR